MNFGYIIGSGVQLGFSIKCLLGLEKVVCGFFFCGLDYFEFIMYIFFGIVINSKVLGLWEL